MNEQDRREQCQKIADGVMKGAKGFVMASKLLNEIPAEGKAWLLVNEVPDELLEPFMKIGNFDPESLSAAQLKEVVLAATALFPYFK